MVTARCVTICSRAVSHKRAKMIYIFAPLAADNGISTGRGYPWLIKLFHLPRRIERNIDFPRVINKTRKWSARNSIPEMEKMEGSNDSTDEKDYPQL